MEINVHADHVILDGTLTIPDRARGIVVFAHGSGSSRFSERNQRVAQTLNQAGFATLLFDLLSNEEHAMDILTQNYRFNIPLLSRRLVEAVDWVSEESPAASLPIGLFGASTGATAALIAAARRPHRILAVVSRGGRPDLAGDSLEDVRSPTLLIVGQQDVPVIGLNREAMTRLAVEHQLVLVPGATHLFEEPGTLEEVARLASDWFGRFLGARVLLPAGARHEARIRVSR